MDDQEYLVVQKHYDILNEWEKDDPLIEEDELNPLNNPYAGSKYASESTHNSPTAVAVGAEG